MIKQLTDTFKNFDLKIKKVMKYGLYFSLLISIIGTLCLLFYISFKTSNFLYYIGIKIVWLSFSFCASFIVSAFAMDRIQKDLI